MVKIKMTIENLAGMIKRSFDHMDNRFDRVENRLEKIEKLLLEDH